MAAPGDEMPSDGSVSVCGAWGVNFRGLVVVSCDARRHLSYILHVPFGYILYFNRGASTCIMLVHVLGMLWELDVTLCSASYFSYSSFLIVFIYWGTSVVLGAEEVLPMGLVGFRDCN